MNNLLTLKTVPPISGAANIALKMYSMIKLGREKYGRF
nr:MAG TPA: hypothetical protein [Caudoviricetes sp.]